VVKVLILNTVTQAPKTKRELVDWVLQNWGRYDAGMIGELNIPLKNTLDGGQGRGKVSLAEKVEYIADLYVTEGKKGLTWNGV
jgi:hypothetical protein